MPRMFSAHIAGTFVAISWAMLGMTTSLGAQSDRWVEVGGSENVTVFADRLSIRRNGARVRVWTKWRFATAREIEFYRDKKYRSEKSLDVYNCANRTSATVQTIYYAEADAGGEVVDARSVPEARAGFTDLAPETMGEAIFTFVCRSFARKRR
jgi:hypothetical protein